MSSSGPCWGREGCMAYREVTMLEVKEVLRLNANHTFDELIEIMPRQLAEARSGDEAKEGFQAFFDKRKPAWVGDE